MGPAPPAMGCDGKAAYARRASSGRRPSLAISRRGTQLSVDGAEDTGVTGLSPHAPRPPHVGDNSAGADGAGAAVDADALALTQLWRTGDRGDPNLRSRCNAELA